MLTIRTFLRSDIPAAAAIYCPSFAEYPWLEFFAVEDVEREIADVMTWPDAVMAVATINDRIVGAAYGFAVGRKPDVVALVDVAPESFYVSEIFVDRTVRGRGIARQLVDDLLRRVPNLTTGVVRTSVEQPIIQRLFQERGWQIAAEQEVMSEKSIDGQKVTAPDYRVIMVGRT